MMFHKPDQKEAKISKLILPPEANDREKQICRNFRGNVFFS